MGVDRDDGDDRRARLEWMINEFEEARRRRLVKADDRVVESDADTDMKPAPAKPTTSHS
jgi:hypothetical protein